RKQPQVRPPQPIYAAARRWMDPGRTLARFGGTVLAHPGGSDPTPERAMNHWPKLDYAADKGTIETLHLLLQLIGKLPLRLHPWVNHGWHTALKITPRGAASRSLPGGAGHFTAELDFLD